MLFFETERLTLRELTIDDAPFILNLLNTPGWLKYIGDRGVKNLTDSEAYISKSYIKAYKDHGFGMMLVIETSSNTPIGICGLIKRDSLEDIDIGFAFLPAYENKGYGYESASTLLSYGKEQLGLKRVVAITVKYNYSSIKLIQKLGLTFEKCFVMDGDTEELMLFGAYL